jgi:hypothetical protein
MEPATEFCKVHPNPGDEVSAIVNVSSKVIAVISLGIKLSKFVIFFNINKNYSDSLISDGNFNERVSPAEVTNHASYNDKLN